MSARTFPEARTSLLQDTQRAWAIEQDHREGRTCRWCALEALTEIEQSTASPKLRRLCEALAYAMFPEVPRPQPEVPTVEVYAR